MSILPCPFSLQDLRFCSQPLLLVGLLWFFGWPMAGHAQEQPLSRQDSAVISANLNIASQALTRNDHRAAVDAYGKVAFTYWNDNHYRMAIRYYEEALKANMAIANENGEAMIHSNLGMLYADVEDYAASLYHFDRTLAARRSFQDKNSIISAQVNRSVVLNRLGRFNESVAALEEASKLAKELSDVNLLASTYGMLSETYEKMENAEKSLYYFSLYRSLVKQEQNHEQERLIYDLETERLRTRLSEMERQLKEQEADSIRRILNKVDKTNQQLYSTLSRSELEVQVLRKDSALRVLELSESHARNEQQRMRWMWGTLALTASLLVAGLITLLVVRNNRRAQRYNEILTERNATISRQNAELVSLNAVKDKLFSIISHDLRGPIATLRGSVGLIQSGALNAQQQAFILDSLNRELDYTLELIETLLHWAKSQMAGLQVNKEQCDVSDLIYQTIQVLKPVADRKKIEITNNITEPLWLAVDPEIVKLIFRNLISNAVKFTASGGKIDIKAQPATDEIVFSVTDTGIGMSAENAARLFNNETHFTTKGTQQEKGTGLGLLMCRDFVRLHQGRIWVESTQGQGSIFCVALPASSGSAPLS